MTEGFINESIKPCMSLDAIFDDKRVLAMLIAGWTFTICIIFICIMVDDESPFLSFGPNPRTVLFGFKLDTWTKWGCVAMYTFVSTCIADFTSDSVGPWITNTIQDHKNMYLPYSKWTCVCIVQTFSMYAIIMGTIHLFVALSQIDFMLMRMFADLIVNYYTTRRFMQFKHVDPDKYASHLDMMKDYDTVLITHNKPHEDDIQVVSPCVVMKVVSTQYAPVPDDMDGADGDLKDLLCR
jgi:hypothetical protein